jgi:mxaK protein
MNARWARLFATALIGLGIAATLDGYALIQAHQENQAISEGAAVPSSESRLNLLFASAYRLAAAGQTQEALLRYQRVIQYGPPDLQIAARYNSAGIHLRQAEQMLHSSDPAVVAQSLPFLELAKLAYREVLRDEPEHWDARYNLERVLRLAPEREQDDTEDAGRIQRERAAPTVQGATQGLP